MSDREGVLRKHAAYLIKQGAPYPSGIRLGHLMYDMAVVERERSKIWNRRTPRDFLRGHMYKWGVHNIRTEKWLLTDRQWHN